MQFTFKDYLIEAKFSEDDFSRVMATFEKRLPKLLGANIYRDGGSTGVHKLGGGEAYLYFFGDRAFQVRAKGGHVFGVDVWSKYALNKGPDFTIDVSELNSPTLLGAITILARLIKSPAEGTTEVKQVTESLQLDEMAKRVDADAFYNMVKQTIGAEAAKAATWEQIKDVADTNDVLIPAYLRAQKVGRGRWNTEPGAEAAGGAELRASAPPPEAATKKKDPILYIKVTAQDPDTKRFIPSGDSKMAQALYAQLQTALEAPPTDTEIKDPETLYGHLAQLVEMACTGKLRSLVVYGGPGTGKTFTIMKTIDSLGLSKGKDYQKLSGKASPIEIYKTLFMFRDGGLIVFDDLDSMWGNADATNILKAALDTSPVREISWASANTVNVSRMGEEEREQLFRQVDDQIDTDPTNSKIKYPSSFDFTGRVIFISNLRRDEFDPAIMSRSAKINMDLTPAQMLDRMRKILPTLGGDDVSMDKKEELLDHLLVMHKRKEITAVTMREFTKGLDVVRSGAPNWKDLVIYM